MKNIHGKDTKIEVILRKALWSKGYRYRKNYKKLPGSPDIVLTKYKIAIFCDGEFFHGKDWDTLKKRLEKSNNSEFWIINKEDILRTIKNVKPLESEKYEKVFEEMDNSILLESNTGNIKNAIKYTKLSTNDELILKLQLLK